MVARRIRDNSVVRWFKRRFLTGLLVLMPTVLTAYVLYRVFMWVDGILGPITERYPFLDIPGLGFLGVIVIILLAGVIGGGFFGRTLFRWFEGGLEKIPMVRSIYVAIKQVSEVFLKQERSVFKEVVLVQYPRPGVYVIGFVTATWRFKGADGREDDFVAIFLPTTPNPTSGILLMVRREEAIPADLSLEDAMKMVISGGAVVPPGRRNAACGPEDGRGA
ncbi:MAG: DUF502 domain-containing protein [Candidatus Krumholzibacteriia bacterium]